MTFGDNIDNTKFINRSEKAKQHVPPPDSYKPMFNRTETRRFRDIKIDRGAERMKPRVITVLKKAPTNSVNQIMQDSLLAQVKSLLASKVNCEMTPAPNAYTLPTFTDNLQMKIRCRLQNKSRLR